MAGHSAPRLTVRVLGGGFASLLAAVPALGGLAGVSPPANRLPAHKTAHHAEKNSFSDIPPGPLQIIISIGQQKLHLYGDGMHVADAPVATGVPQHPTPLGVFSVITKNRYHESNIYSAAPMPYMQRITWSGIALHEGVGVGRPASHGCIRMPHAFAVRLWTLTRLGARVIIARPELRPADFADPHLFVHKAPPQDVTVMSAIAAPRGDETPGEKQTAASTAGELAAASPEAVRVITTNATAASLPAVAPQSPPMPVPKPAGLVRAAARKSPISIFVSRKKSRIYVRQNFEPVFAAAITITEPERPLGTHVFTALNYVDAGTTFRWNVVSLPGEPAKPRQGESGRKRQRSVMLADPPPDTPQDALSRIEIPPDVVDQISAMIVPGSSLIVSDQGLGEETGQGTDFIIVAR